MLSNLFKSFNPDVGTINDIQVKYKKSTDSIYRGSSSKKSKPGEEGIVPAVPVEDDNCSIIRRNDKIYIYKDQKNISTIDAKEFDLHSFITSENFLNASSLIFCHTSGGKTVFTSHLIYKCLKLNSHLKFAIILFSTNKAANALYKLKWTNQIYQESANYNIDFNNQVLVINTINELTSLYAALEKISVRRSKKAQQKLEGVVAAPEQVHQANKTSEEDEANNQEEMLTVLDQFTNYIFYFDDCNEVYTESVYSRFFKGFATSHRHQNITVLYNAQSVYRMNNFIKVNLTNLFTIGFWYGEPELRALYRNMPAISFCFKSEQCFVKLAGTIFQKIFKKKTILLYSIGNPGVLTHYTIPKKFIDAMNGYEKKFKNKLNVNS